MLKKITSILLCMSLTTPNYIAAMEDKNIVPMERENIFGEKKTDSKHKKTTTKENK